METTSNPVTTGTSNNTKDRKDYGSRADKKALITYETAATDKQTRGGTFAMQHGSVKSIYWKI